MLRRMQATFKKAGQQLHAQTIFRLPIMDATELTKSTWAKPIKSISQVPNAYKDFFQTLLSDGRNFPNVILVPSLERFIHKTTEKLLCETGSELYVLERAGDTCEVLCYPFECIRYVVYRTRLLDACIKIRGVTDRGVSTSSTIKFNAVSDYLFLPVLEGIRGATFDSRSMTQGPELEKFDYLVRLNYKFMNYAKKSLIGGEKVVHAIFQAEIRESVWTVLGKTYSRKIFPTHMSILTDHELITIRENEIRGREDKYGGTWNYFPLSQIDSISMNEKDEHLLALSIQLPEDEQFKYLFQDSLGPEVNQLMVRFQELTTTA